MNDFLILDEYAGKGLQEGEQELPNDEAAGAGAHYVTFYTTTDFLKASAEPEVNAEALAQLEGLGFPTVRCKKALLANGMNPDAAVQWIFEHMDDPDIDTPIVPTGSSSQAAPADPGMVSMLQDMGFTAAQASKALRETVRTSYPGASWLSV